MPATLPFVYERAIRFEEVDAAGIVFFARYLNLCHEAMEAFFAPLDGGYSRLIMDRKLGVPAVRVDSNYHSPLRYGDTVNIQVSSERIGRTSATFKYEFQIASTNRLAAVVHHTVVCCDMATLRPTPWPDDVRSLIEEALRPRAQE